MRRIVTAITAAALALSLVSMATPANAVAGYDSAYAGESAFLTLQPGTSGTFTVFFQNTGTTSWAKGTATQVDLAACLEDKVTCNSQDASEAPFASGWLSTTRYATHTQTTVAPGSIGTFTYNVAAPSGQAAGTYRFNGALVLSSTGADIHNEGYYQDVTIPATVGSCTPTTITTSPTSANNQVGVTHTQTATVKCAAPSGSTTQPAAVGAQVTFVIDAPISSLNADQTLTATTDANGLASVSWTRSNPDVDNISVYPTSTPAVRATATKTWSAGASVITCTPTEAATQLAGTSRTYTVQVNSPTTGSASTNPVTVSKGSSDTATLSGTALTPDSTGKALFSVTGTDTQFATPKVKTTFTISGTATDYTATCGKVTFEAVKAATVTLTPDTTASQAMGSHRIFTLTVLDQFGAAFTGTMQASFTELTDSDSTTVTGAVIDPAPTTTAPSAAATTACPASTGFSGNQKATVTLSSTGTAYFQVCAAAADSGKTTTVGTPIAWQDKDGNGVPGTGEGQDTGGATTWEAAAATSAKLSPSSATNAASSDTTPGTNNGTFGEETYKASIVDQSGNQINPAAAATVVITVTNTGANTIYITQCANSNGTAGTPATPITITTGASATCTGTLATTGLETMNVELDANAASSANLTAQITSGSTIFTSATSTKTWVKVDTDANTLAAASVVTGTVAARDTTQDYYVIQTTSAGNFQVQYFNGDTFLVDGSSTVYATFESNITVGDKVTFTKGATNKHELTNQ